MRGFTLVELSIVIVIIGLIIGGVMVGRDMVIAAERRNLLSTLEKYNTAINTFRTKYGCLPGDCRNATDFLALDIPNGNGDGVIGNHWNVSANWYPQGWLSKGFNLWNSVPEPLALWDSLSQTGFIDAKFAGVARQCINDVMVSWPTSYCYPGYGMPTFGGNGLLALGVGGKTYWRTGVSYYAHGAGVDIKTTYSFTPADGLYFSSKISDGTPRSRVVIPVGTWDMYSIYNSDNTTISSDISPNAGPCISTTNNTWNLSQTSKRCSFLFRTNF